MITTKYDVIVVGAGHAGCEAAAAVSAGAVAAVGIAGVGHVDMRLRQFVEEARRDGRLPQAVDAAVGDEPQMQVPLGPRQAHIGEAAFLLQS